MQSFVPALLVIGRMVKGRKGLRDTLNIQGLNIEQHYAFLNKDHVQGLNTDMLFRP